jgi:CHAD domain-containing protein
MRIALTRLRAIVQFFSPMTKDIAWLRLKKKLRWLNSAPGTARDHDVTMIYARRNRYWNWAKPVSHALARAKEKSHQPSYPWLPMKISTCL